jgi:hypothetical protein
MHALLSMRFTAVPRRGMMLLIVLSLLSMFLMLGTLLIVNTSRSRLTARAFAAATASNASSATLARRQLDMALMKLVAGPSQPAATNDVTESLLEDKFGAGTAVEGRVLSVADNGPLLTASVDINVAKPVALNGRIITFLPKPQDGGSIASYRILRTTGTASPYTCELANLRRARAAALPTKPCDAIVNGPEFRGEAYDAYDANNQWLTQVTLENGGVKTVPRPAFGTSAPSVDNDDDGVADGVWLTGVLPSLPTSDGGMLDFEVSYLVLDLDGRLNLNAHGTSTSVDTASSAWVNSPDVPIGNGYGPADIDASTLFVEPLANNQTQTNPPAPSAKWTRLIRGGDATITGTAASATQRRPTPILGLLEGRYGTPASASVPPVPGVAGNDQLSQIGEAQYGTDQTIDYKCRIKTWMDMGSQSTAAVPTLMYFTPDWNAVGFADDPYEIRLDPDAPRTGALAARTGSHADNPFTPAELERVLRQFDPDASLLPQRLAAVLDNFAERSRSLVTTESWDTPALTGDVAAEIASFALTLQKPYEILSPDVAAGLRFDINRPLTDETSQQEYCKHLYTLLVALGQPANETTAQWAVNALTYRTGDSKMLRFQFDRNLVDGWQVNDTDVVWGAERPELVIAQTLAWRDGNDPNAGELYVTLYHPWAAKAVRSDGTQVPIATISPDLGADNKLDLRRKAGSDPIWRLRFDSTKIIRFDAMTTVPASTFGSSQTLQNDATQMAPDTYLCIKPSGNSTNGVSIDNALPTFPINQGGPFLATQQGSGSDPTTDADSMMVLERLADPAKPFHATTNPYRPVDQLGIKLINRSGSDPNNWRSFYRSPPFWKQQRFSKTTKPPKLTELDMNATNWFPWPNRPFISQAELALVPGGDATAMLSAYEPPKNKNDTVAYLLPTEELLDATIVPSRFAGTSLHVADPTALSNVGMDKIPSNQISRWREPGRVNLNTIVSNTACADPQLDQAVWRAVLGQDANIAWNPFAATAPATSVRDMLTLKQGTTMFRDSAATSGGGNTNGNANWKKNREYDFNPALTYATAVRLANVATIRSNVFAVWITLKVTDSTTSFAAPSYHRLFAIVDRSVPVGFNAGEPLNARDTIRLQRFLE